MAARIDPVALIQSLVEEQSNKCTKVIDHGFDRVERLFGSLQTNVKPDKRTQCLKELGKEFRYFDREFATCLGVLSKTLSQSQSKGHIEPNDYYDLVWPAHQKCETHVRYLMYYSRDLAEFYDPEHIDLLKWVERIVKDYDTIPLENGNFGEITVLLKSLDGSMRSVRYWFDQRIQ